MGKPGCRVDRQCETRICEIDTYCCYNQWDNTCVMAAETRCTITYAVSLSLNIYLHSFPSLRIPLDMDIVKNRKLTPSHFIFSHSQFLWCSCSAVDFTKLQLTIRSQTTAVVSCNSPNCDSPEHELTMHNGMQVALVFGNIIFILILLGIIGCCIFHRRKKISGNDESPSEGWIAMGRTMNEIEVMAEDDEQPCDDDEQSSPSTTNGTSGWHESWTVPSQPVGLLPMGIGSFNQTVNVTMPEQDKLSVEELQQRIISDLEQLRLRGHNPVEGAGYTVEGAVANYSYQ